MICSWASGDWALLFLAVTAVVGYAVGFYIIQIAAWVIEAFTETPKP